MPLLCIIRTHTQREGGQFVDDAFGVVTLLVFDDWWTSGRPVWMPPVTERHCSDPLLDAAASVTNQFICC